MGQENVPRKERVALELISFQKIGLEMNPVINQQTSNNQSEGNQRAQNIMMIRWVGRPCLIPWIDEGWCLSFS